MKIITRKILLGLTASVLSGTLVLSGILPNWQLSSAATPDTQGSGEGLVRNVTGTVDANLEDYFDTSVVQKLPETVAPDREISVILSLEESTLLDAYHALGATKLSLGEYAVSNEGRAISARILRESKSLENKLKNAGIPYTLGNRYDTLLSGFEVTIAASAFDQLCNAVKGAAGVMVSEEYAECKTEVVENDVNVYKTGIFDSHDSEYDGSGTVIAVLDTGLDYTHSAFSVDNFHPSKDDIITTEYINARLSRLSASKTTPGLSAASVYRNRKVPYAYDYADKDADVFPINNEHGTHVAGIMVGKDDEITGVAPNAQLAVMKVFSEATSGAKQSWILSALEDCVVLDVDVINMSLGSAAGFSRASDDERTERIYDSIKEEGISLVAAASNDYNSTFGSEKNGNLGLTTNPDSATVGAPSTYDAALSVASISGKKTPYLMFNGEVVYFTESSDRASEPKDFVAEILKEGEQTKDFDFVTIPGVGREYDYNGIDVSGKIALVKRGQTNFEDKARIARDKGAVGCIIYNNVPGDISMTVGSIGDYPVCSVSRDDGILLTSSETAEGSGRGTITISRDQTAGPFMSNFSSWGPTPDLSIKPEITAHGGDIYSAVPGQRYDRLSGTSMACPNQAGVTALIRQYVKEKFGLSGSDSETRRKAAAIVNQIMMSTTDIANNTNGLPFSVRKQGAGLANLTKATTTPAYLRSYDRKTDAIMDKAKIEIGDDPAKNGVYDLKFDIVNVGNSPLSYDVGAYVMTEGVSENITIRGDQTVTEKGYMLSASVSVKSVDGGTFAGNVVSLSGGQTATVVVEIVLSDSDRSYLETNFRNGMYIEGFVTLKPTEGTDVSLNIPYLGFYGSWAQAPMFDLDYFVTNKDELDESIDIEEKTLPDAYATRPVGGLYADYIAYLGSFAYLQDPASTNIISASREHIALTNQEGENGGVNNISSIWLGMLRGAKRIVATVTDSTTGEVIWEQTTYNQRKSYSSGSTIYPSSLDIDFFVREHNLKNNTKYDFEVKGYLDFDDDGATTNLNNSFGFSFYTDFEAPIVTDVKYTSEYDEDAKKNRLYAEISIYDNHYLQGVVPGYISENEPGSEYRYTLYGFSRYVVPAVSGTRNSTTVVQLELTDHLEDIKKHSYTGNTFMLQTMDFAGNSSTYEIEIPDNIRSISFKEEGSAVSISPNQTYKLEPNIFPAQDTSWAETINYTSTNEDVVRIVAGKLVGVSSGSAKVIATSNEDSSVQAELDVTVLKEGDPGYQVFNKPVAENFRLTGYTVNKVFYFQSSDERDLGTDEAGDNVIQFTGNRYSLKMFPSESVTLKYELDGYFKEGDYKVEFMSGNPDIVDVTSEGVVTATNVSRDPVTGEVTPLNLERSSSITVMVYMKDANGQFVRTTYSRTISVTVKESYKTNGPYLMSYMGLGDTVVIPEEFGSTEIYQYAFSNYQYIPKDLAAGDVIDKEDPYTSKIWYIGESSIKKVVVPEGVETIGPYAFANLTGLREIELPSTLTKIQAGAFLGCTALTTVKFPKGNNLQFVNQNAFQNCNMLTTFDFKSIIAVGDYAFAGANLMRITLPASAQSIGAYAFLGNTRLDRVTIAAEIVKLGSGAFAGCERLETMSINASVIPAGVFEGCERLKNVKLGKDVAVIEQYAFRDTLVDSIDVEQGNETFQTGSNYLVERATGKLALVGPAVENFVGGSEIKTVGTGAFSSTRNLRSVSIPSATAVEDYAFAECETLATVNLGKLTSVGNYAFANTAITALPEIEAGTNIGEYAFYGTRITQAELPDDLTVGDYAFAASERLNKVVIGENTTVGEAAFYASVNVGSVKVGDGSVLGEGAFAAITSAEYMGSIFTNGMNVDGLAVYINAFISAISEIEIGDNVVIGPHAFRGAGFEHYAFSDGREFGGVLERVTLGENVTIGDYAFYGCQYLTDIDLSSVKSVGESAFSGLMTGYVIYQGQQIAALQYFVGAPLTEVDLSAAESVGMQAFALNEDLASVKFGSSLETIGAQAFYGCAGIEYLDLENVTEIEAGAFGECVSLIQVELANQSVIGDAAFEGDTALINVVGLDRAVYIGASAFAGVGLTQANLGDVVYLGDYAFGSSKVEKVVLSDKLLHIGENPFTGCNIPAFISTVNGEETDTYDLSESVKVIDGVLYRVTVKGIELICYPLGKAERAYTVADNTVRIGAGAFAQSAIAAVTLPRSVAAIGDKAFYGCLDLAVVVFTGIDAPILEEEYDYDYDNGVTDEGIDLYIANGVGLPVLHYTNGTTSYSGLGIVPYVMWNMDPTIALYGANFVGYIGRTTDETVIGRETLLRHVLTMVRPKNGVGYENFIYSQYFDVVVDGMTAATDTTLNIVGLIDELPTMITLGDKATVRLIRSMVDSLPDEQKALVTNLSKLTEAEATIEYLMNSHTHYDADGDGYCDECGDAMSAEHEHVDSDGDGKCDICGADMSAEHEHVDSDGDGKCDICGADMSENTQPEKGSLIWLYIIIGVVAAIGVAVAVFVLLRKNKNGKSNSEAETDEAETVGADQAENEETEEAEASPKQDDGDGSEE